VLLVDAEMLATPETELEIATGLTSVRVVLWRAVMPVLEWLVTLSRVIVVVERISVWELEYPAELEAAEGDELAGTTVAPYVTVADKGIASCAATIFTVVKSISKPRNWKCMITVAYWG
jgi:hypothetical protein